MYSVYALGDPRTNQVRYIGIAQDVYKRYAQHLNRPHHNDVKNVWMQEIKQAGIVPTLTILETNIDEAIIYKREKHWIQHYLTLGTPLTNVIHALVEPSSLQWVAKRLRVSERTVLRLLETKELNGSKVGRVWHIEPEDLADYIKRQKEAAANS